MTAETQPRLFEPLTIRGVKTRNRIVISPMCQYSAVEGVPNDWHVVHLGRFATGGAGIVFTEATAVEARGRITPGCTGLWNDEQAQAHARIVSFHKAHGAVPGIQLAHAGRKASAQRPWHGNGPLTDADRARGDIAWKVVGPTTLPVGDDWPVPDALSADELVELVEAFAAAARRALTAGYEIVEIHGAHGYLIQSFLSPIANQRKDAYGGDRQGRMRLALEVTEAVRAAWPEDKPLFFRVSAEDGVADGWQLEDTIVLARELKRFGVDVIDCSSGGIRGPVTAAGAKRQPGYQVPFAETVRREADVMTQAVGLITHPKQAEAILRAGSADLIAIAREALLDPSWAHHAALTLSADTEFENWPEQYGWWLVRRATTSEFYQDDAA